MSETHPMNTDPFGAALRDPAFLEKTKKDAALRNMTVEERRQPRINEFEANKAAAAEDSVDEYDEYGDPVYSWDEA